MKIEKIRSLLKQGRYYFYKHALTEAKKDGIEPEDIEFAILHGEIIEKYPERNRCLIFCYLYNRIPIHVICDYSNRTIILIVTVYIPNENKWINFKIRRK